MNLHIELPADIARTVCEVLEDMRHIRSIEFAVQAIQRAAEQALQELLSQEPDAEPAILSIGEGDNRSNPGRFSNGRQS